VSARARSRAHVQTPLDILRLRSSPYAPASPRERRGDEEPFSPARLPAFLIRVERLGSFLDPSRYRDASFLTGLVVPGARPRQRSNIDSLNMSFVCAAAA